jgi:hypothetical protein
MEYLRQFANLTAYNSARVGGELGNPCVSLIKDDMHVEYDPYQKPGPEMVDLGLPSGTLWAKYNLGVNPTQLSQASDWYGGYYAWGELEPKESYTWENYRFGTNHRLTKYNNTDQLNTLLPEDDIITVTYGNEYCMPSIADLNELIDNVDSQWEYDYLEVTGLNGRKIMKKSNHSVFIFIPAAAYIDRIYRNQLGYIGDIWTSTVDAMEPDGMSKIIWSDRTNNGFSANRIYRNHGIPVRAIKRVSQS